MLTEQEVSSYKNRLEKEREKLIKELRESSSPVDFGAKADPDGEEADEAEELSNTIAATPILRERIQRVEEALVRIEKGEYGKCQKCGADINKEILNLVPESYLCGECK